MKTACSRSHNCDEFFVAKLSFNLWLVIGSYVFFVVVNVIQKNDNVGNILDIPEKNSIYLNHNFFFIAKIYLIFPLVTRYFEEKRGKMTLLTQKV